MSQSAHRSRLREYREREEALGNRPPVQAGNTPAQPQFQPPAAPAAQAPMANQDVKIVTATPLPVPQIPTAEQTPQPLVTPAIVPTTIGAEFETRGMTPSELRVHGKRTAEILAQLPADQYRDGLASLQQVNPNLYGIVCDELNNMQAESGEDDGVDLSNIAGGPPNPNLPA